jgi:hypothetical protein
VTVSLQGPLITKDKDDGIVYKSEGDLRSEDPELINDFANASNAQKDHFEGEDKTEWSQVTFNLSNLNYIKKRLFEPEMRFFKEQLKEVYSEYTRGIKGDVQTQLAITSKDLSDKILLLE